MDRVVGFWNLIFQQFTTKIRLDHIWGIHFKRLKPMILTEKDCKKGFFPTTMYDIPDDPAFTEDLKININTNKLVGFVDITHENNI